MKNNLIERYIYAVTKRLPSKMQKDVSREISGLIEDMLSERCGDVTPSEKDIKVVLTELGSPSELAEKYASSDKNCLIGAPYFVTYKYVLKIVLICVGVGMILSAIISYVINNIDISGNSGDFQQTVSFSVDLFVNLFTMLVSGLVWGFAFVTLIFAVFYHKDINIDKDNLDSLPPVPKKEISKADSIIGIAVSVAFAVIFILVPQIFCAVIDGKTFIPIFNVEQVQSYWYL